MTAVIKVLRPSCGRRKFCNSALIKVLGFVNRLQSAPTVIKVEFVGCETRWEQNNSPGSCASSIPNQRYFPSLVSRGGKGRRTKATRNVNEIPFLISNVAFSWCRHELVGYLATCCAGAVSLKWSLGSSVCVIFVLLIGRPFMVGN